MNSEPTKPLILVAGPGRASQRCARILDQARLSVRRARSWMQAMDYLEGEEAGLLILEPGLKGMHLQEGLRLMRKINPQLLALVLGPLPAEVQAELLNTGAEGILPANLPPAHLVDWVKSYGQRQRLRQENQQLRSHLLEAEAYLAQILEQLGEGMLTTNLEGRVLSANYLIHQFLNLKTGSLYQRSLESLGFIGHGLQNLAEAVNLVLDQDSCEGRFLLIPEGGAAFPVNFRGRVYLQEGRRVGTILVFRDLTAQEELELRLEESERLAALGQIASGMAHEIRNPLMAVGGLARRCERHLAEGHPARAYLPAIMENVRRMETMVREIDEYLGFVRASGDELTEVDLKTILHLALTRLEGAADLEVVQLQVEVLPALKIMGHEASLVEMFFQILRNGVEAMPEGGTLGLKVSEIGGWAVVRISDTGRGISPQELTSISHPFFTTKMSGAGMGLTKVYMIAGRHRGQVEVESHPGQGSTFTIRLPLLVL